jgi:deoxyxylulose-5-phosphate synthase
MISHLGPQLAVADGIALASKLNKSAAVTLVFSGEGGTSEGDFHEALNVASVWNLPVIFVVENNGYALSTPTNEQFRCDSIADKAQGYGIEGMTIDGNDFVNNLAKSHYRWGQSVNVVVRMPTGAGTGAGPFHSQSNEAWFAHTPGLKIAYPSIPSDAKGLLMTALEDPNPVMFFEHKGLYRSISGEVPHGAYFVPFGKARLHREGDQVAVITYGAGVHWANTIAEEHPEWSIAILLMPLGRGSRGSTPSCRFVQALRGSSWRGRGWLRWCLGW